MSTRTGVRDEEAFAALPGDEVIAQPMVQWTRGVTVAAPAEAVWPWLVQAGHGRAGWYTPKWVDNITEPTLFRTRNVDRRADSRIHPAAARAHPQHYAPKVLAPLVPVAGLFDATYGVAMLRAIARRAEQRRQLVG